MYVLELKCAKKKRWRQSWNLTGPAVEVELCTREVIRVVYLKVCNKEFKL